MNRNVNYDQLTRRLQQLTADVPYEITNLSNTAALLWQALPDINWAGFYKMMDGMLVLYPFQGKTACVRILCPQRTASRCSAGEYLCAFLRQ